MFDKNVQWHFLENIQQKFVKFVALPIDFCEYVSEFHEMMRTLSFKKGICIFRFEKQSDNHVENKRDARSIPYSCFDRIPDLEPRVAGPRCFAGSGARRSL